MSQSSLMQAALRLRICPGIWCGSLGPPQVPGDQLRPHLQTCLNILSPIGEELVDQGQVGHATPPGTHWVLSGSSAVPPATSSSI